MSTADKLLALLVNTAGDWVSGEAIAQQLGLPELLYGSLLKA